MAMDAHQKGSCRPSCAGSRARFQFCRIGSNSAAQHARRNRSEEHTSELQSRLHLVCRLLLEKKNTNELAGLKYMSCGEPIWVMCPRSITAIWAESASASDWSCVTETEVMPILLCSRLSSLSC